MPQITAIEVQAGRKNRRSVFVDGEFFCGADARVVRRLRLEVGQEIAPEELQRLLAAAEEAQAREKVLRLLDRRAYTRRQLENKLRQRGTDPDVIRTVLDRLQAAGLVNDEAYARTWIQAPERQGAMGRRRISAELSRIGIDRATAEAVMASEAPGDEANACKELALRKAPAYRHLPRETARRRLSAFLARRGFDMEDVRQAVDRVLPVKEEE